ncbi:hypothetical protein [Streptomyces sp. NPDC050988]|uniref:hypothetical protein n=1 Tax=Streptomyces sp. NPDC050988 TaxID=3365637 RepID=UPI00379905EB
MLNRTNSNPLLSRGTIRARPAGPLARPDAQPAALRTRGGGGPAEDGRDVDWGAASDLLVQDHDVLMMFDDSLDGIEDGGNNVNQALGMVNLAPLDWFTPFDPEQEALRQPGRSATPCQRSRNSPRSP